MFEKTKDSASIRQAQIERREQEANRALLAEFKRSALENLGLEQGRLSPEKLAELRKQVGEAQEISANVLLVPKNEQKGLKERNFDFEGKNSLIGIEPVLHWQSPDKKQHQNFQIKPLQEKTVLDGLKKKFDPKLIDSLRQRMVKGRLGEALIGVKENLARHKKGELHLTEEVVRADQGYVEDLEIIIQQLK